MKSSSAENSPAGTILEFVFFPLIFALPGFVLYQLFLGVKQNINFGLFVFTTIVITAIMFAAFHMLDLRLRNRPFPLFSSIFLAQTAFFVCFYIIFASQESFRLPQQTMFQISVAFAVVLYFIQSAIMGRIVFRKNYLNLPMALILGFGLLSFAFSSDFWISLKDYLVLLSIVVLFWLMVNQWDARRHFGMVITLALLIGGIMSFIGVAQHFNLNEIYGIGQNFDTFSTLGNKNYVAELMAMLLPLALAALLIAKTFWHKIVIWFGIECMLFVVVIAETRGSWMGLLVGLGVLLLFGLDGLDRRRARQLVFLIITLIANALLIMFMSHHQIIFDQGPIPYIDRFMSIVRVMNSVLSGSIILWLLMLLGVAVLLFGSWFMLRTKGARTTAATLIIGVTVVTLALVQVVKRQERIKAEKQAAVSAEQAPALGPRVLDDSIASRRYIYGGTLQMIKHNPLGTGIGAYKIHYLSMLKAHLKASKIEEIPGFFKDVNAKEAHNEYLHTWAEQGPIGLLLVIFFIVRLIQYFYRLNYKKQDADTRVIVLGAFAGLAAIGAAAMLGFPFRIVPTAAVCGLLLTLMVFGEDRLAAAAALENPDRNDPPVMLDPRRWRFIPLDVIGRVGLPAAAFLLFAFVTTWSYNWQMANILMKDGEKYMRAADAQLRSGNKEAGMQALDQARNIYLRSLKLDPSNGEIHFKLGMFYQSMADREQKLSDGQEKQYDNAIASLAESLKYYDLPQARLNLGAAYFHKGEIYFERARLPEHIDDSDKVFNKGYDYFKSAEKQFEETISLYPNYSLPWFNLALIKYEYARHSDEKHQNKLFEAYNLRKQIEQHPDLKDKPEIEKKIERLETDGQKEMAKAREMYFVAKEMFKKTLAIEPTLIVANFKLGICLERLNLYEEARIQYEKTAKFSPSKATDNATLADTYYNLGILYATQSLALSAETRSQDISAARQKELAKLFIEYKNNARTMFERAIDLNYYHIKAHNNLANILYKDGENRKAMEHYEAALDINPNYPEARLNLTLVKLNIAHEDLRNGNEDARYSFMDTMRSAQQMMANNPTGIQRLKLMRIIGVCQKNLGETDNAKQTLNSIIASFQNTPEQFAPDYSLTLINLAETYSEEGDMGKAMEYIKKVAANPSTPIIQLQSIHRLAMWQFDAGDKQGALNTFSKALELQDVFYNEPEYYETVIHYSERLYLTNQLDKGLRVLEDYLQMPISNSAIRSGTLLKAGQFYSALGRIDEAIASFTEIVTNDWPDKAQAEHFLGVIKKRRSEVMERITPPATENGAQGQAPPQNQRPPAQGRPQQPGVKTRVQPAEQNPPPKPRDDVKFGPPAPPPKPE